MNAFESDDVLPKDVLQLLIPRHEEERLRFDASITGQVIRRTRAELKTVEDGHPSQLQKALAFPDRMKKSTLVCSMLTRSLPWHLLLEDTTLHAVLLKVFLHGYAKDTLRGAWNNFTTPVVGAGQLMDIDALEDIGAGLKIVDPATLEGSKKHILKRIESALETFEAEPSSQNRSMFDRGRQELKEFRHLEKNPVNHSPETHDALVRVQKGELYLQPTDHPVLEELMAEEAPFRELLLTMREKIRVLLRTFTRVRLSMSSPQLVSSAMTVLPSGLSADDRLRLAMDIAEGLDPAIVIKAEHETVDGLQIVSSHPYAAQAEGFEESLRQFFSERGLVLGTDDVAVQTSLPAR